MGLDKTDCSLLRKIHGVERSECGYLTDVTLGTSNKAIRLFPIALKFLLTKSLAVVYHGLTLPQK